MTTCEVLRCANSAAAIIPIVEEGAPLIEHVVCADHKALIDGGAPWRWEDDAELIGNGCILMGTDLDARDITITRYVGWEDGIALHPSGQRALTLLLERLWGDGSKDVVRLAVDGTVVRRLVEDLKDWPR